MERERKESARQVSLWFLFWTFVKVGSTAFGGFMALISVVQSLAVERKKLLKHDEMLDGISLASIIPGPVAVNVVAYASYRLRGGIGAAVSATAVILPSFFPAARIECRVFSVGSDSRGQQAVHRIFAGGHCAKLFIVFAGMSVMLFGGGYVFIPLIQEIVVDGQEWVSQKEFIDAIAMGQITPGPILISATFIGYKVAGLAGAIAATVGIFLPPAVLMIAASLVLDYVKESTAINAALRGVRPAVVGLIFAAAFGGCPNRTTRLDFAGDLRRRAAGPDEVAYRGGLDHTRCGSGGNGAVLM